MSLTVDRNNREIQAFPTHKGTWVGIASNQQCANKIVHIAEDGDVTFHFDSGDIVYSGLSAPWDTVTDGTCTGVTSTATIYIS